MKLMKRYALFVWSIIFSVVLISAKQCGNMSCDWNGNDAECYLFFSFRGMWYYQSKYGVRQGLANVGRSNSCYKYVVKKNVLTTSCIEMEKHCTENGGKPAVINSYQEYINYNEFILDVTRVAMFEPVYRQLLVQVDSLPQAGLNKTCAKVQVKDGWLTDNSGYILAQKCEENTVVNSILCEYSSTEKKNKQPICESTPTANPTTINIPKTSKTTTITTIENNISISTTVYPTPGRDVGDRKTIGLAATTVTIIGLLVVIISLLTCMLLYIGRIKHNRKRERYVVRARHEIRSVHLYDSPMEEWMDKPYLVASQKQTLYSNSDSTDSTNSTILTDTTNEDSHPGSIDYENQRIYSPMCRDEEESQYLRPSQHHTEPKDYYNVGNTDIEKFDVNIIKSIYNPLRPQPHAEIHPSVNDYRPAKPAKQPTKYSYDKLSRCEALTQIPNRYKPKSTKCVGRPPRSSNINSTLQYTPTGVMKSGYHHLERKCTTMGGRNRSEHDYARLMGESAT